MRFGIAPLYRMALTDCWKQCFATVMDIAMRGLGAA
jgi:hypothetical protein